VPRNRSHTINATQKTAEIVKRDITTGDDHVNVELTPKRGVISKSEPPSNKKVPKKSIFSKIDDKFSFIFGGEDEMGCEP
jgi:hypothetical protein